MTRQNGEEQTLHTLNKPASAINLNQEVGQYVCDGDSVVLIEDGVYQCIALPVDIENHWAAKARHIYVLSPDVEARGIQFDSILHAKVIFIDFKAFVKLTLSHKKVISWY